MLALERARGSRAARGAALRRGLDARRAAARAWRRRSPRACRPRSCRGCRPWRSRVRDRDQPVEPALRLAAVDRLARPARRRPSRSLRLAGDDQRRGGVQQRDVAIGALARRRARRAAPPHCARRRRRAARPACRAASPTSSGVISKLRTLPFSSAATLVAPVVVISSSPSEPCTTQARSEPRFFEHLRQRLDPLPREHADHLALDAGRVGQRPEQVEDRAGAELDAGRADMSSSPDDAPART